MHLADLAICIVFKLHLSSFHAWRKQNSLLIVNSNKENRINNHFYTVKKMIC